MEILDILNRLCSVESISGAEAPLFKTVSEILPKGLSISKDNMGNIIVKGGKGEKNILLDAHCDQIGFIVTGICENGFLRVSSVGGIDVRTLIASRVTVFGKQKLLGIFSSIPPHLQKDGDDKNFPEISELAIDIGLSFEKAKEVVSLGDLAVLESSPFMLSAERCCASALDNKAGCCALLSVMNALFSKNTLKNTSVTLLLSVQEELGMRGADAADLEADEAICVDVSFASYPGCAPKITSKLSKGAMIGQSPILSKKLINSLISVAEKNNIPFQNEIMAGATGTNADVISLSSGGIECALISIPLKNMHSTAEIVDIRDIENTAKLIEAYIREADNK